MTLPRLEIFVDTNGVLCISKAVMAGSDSRVIFDIPIDELLEIPPEDAAYRVGGTVLNVLRIWHKDLFVDWEVPPVFDSRNKYE